MHGYEWPINCTRTRTADANGGREQQDAPQQQEAENEAAEGDAEEDFTAGLRGVLEGLRDVLEQEEQQELVATVAVVGEGAGVEPETETTSDVNPAELEEWQGEQATEAVTTIQSLWRGRVLRRQVSHTLLRRTKIKLLSLWS